MVDEAGTQPADAVERCPWCSAEIAAGLANCPACGAMLQGDSETALPGVTALDPEAITRSVRAATPPRRNRILSWISGDYDDGEDNPAAPGSLSLPPPEVEREMLRLELEARVVSLQAEADARAAELEAEARAKGAANAAESREAPAVDESSTSEPEPVAEAEAAAVPADPAADDRDRGSSPA